MYVTQGVLSLCSIHRGYFFNCHAYIQNVRWTFFSNFVYGRLRHYLY